MSICLNMIVKNEAHVIEETLENITNYINFAYWVICDTGSTDGTQATIRNKFDGLGIQGELFEHEWKDFAHNRTRALECAHGKSDYVFIFDADDKIHSNFILPKLTSDMYHFKFSSTDGFFSYQRPLLVNNTMNWKFVGVLHEYLTNADGISHSCEEIGGDYFVESGKTGDRSKNPNKYKDDAQVLTIAYENETDGRLKERYAFYCAQSYMDDMNFENALYWYKRTLDGGNWDQEKCYSCLMMGNIYNEINNIPNAMKYWTKTSEYDEERPEGIVKIMEFFYNLEAHTVVTSLYNSFKNKIKYIKKDKLFLDCGTFYKAEYFNSVSAYYAGDLPSGYGCIKLLVQNDLFVDLCFNNLQFYIECLKNDPDAHNVFFTKLDIALQKSTDPNQYMLDIWNLLWSTRPALPKSHISPPKCKQQITIMISFTTCKRYSLFQRTVNSIVNTWADISSISHWLCVDDNSSDGDRDQMSQSFPWISFYWKKPNEKGHRESMNIIWREMLLRRPTYWIHMEDDFEFFRKQNYVTDSIMHFQQLQNHNVKQILFNRCYAETIEDVAIKGYSVSEACVDCCIHEHDITIGTGCNYWPHYSLRPSICLVDAIVSLGNYDSDNQFFEMDYATKFTNKGYKSAYFNQITNVHIGRLTKDRFSESDNAYTLNGEMQF